MSGSYCLGRTYLERLVRYCCSGILPGETGQVVVAQVDLTWGDWSGSCCSDRSYLGNLSGSCCSGRSYLERLVK